MALTAVRAMREDRGRFAQIRNARVLIYWPHGLGDWVHFGGITPLLEPSNEYAITRFGDDYVSLMDGHPHLAPLRSGLCAPSDGSPLGASHMGMSLKRCDGRSVNLVLSSPLDEAVARFAPHVLLWTDYPETEGHTAFPFHTKARNLARLLVRPERLATLDLTHPLKNEIDFSAVAHVQERVDERLRQHVPAGGRLCIISRSGVTASRKNWGDGSEARDFVAIMRREPGRWRFVSMDDEHLGEGVAGFRALFGDMDEPFARMNNAVQKRADLYVGIPAGPLHVAMARRGLPVVGLWLAHHPDWYDEPNPNALHLIGRHVCDRGFDRRPATTTKPPLLQHNLRYLDTRGIPGEAVVAAARIVTS